MHNEDTYPRPLGWRRPRRTSPHSGPTAVRLATQGEGQEAARYGKPNGAERGFAVLEDGDSDDTPISEIMPKRVFCATPDMPLDVLAHTMLEGQIGCAPVVDASEQPIGVISKSDLLRALRETPQRHPEGVASSEAAPEADALSTRTARDVMTPVVYWLPEDANISQAAALMAYEHIHSIPVVSKTGRITGMVSTLDILRWFARRRGYLIPR